MKKKLGLVLLTAISLNALGIQAFAANGSLTENDYHTNSWDRFEYNYEFESGPLSTDVFGVPTQTDAIPRNRDTENIRRNKDAALNPPAYGVFSGDIPTSASSLYHVNTAPDYAVNSTNNTGVTDTYYNLGSNGSGEIGVLPSTSTMETATTDITATNQVSISQYLDDNYLIANASTYSDGSIGLLEIPKLGSVVKVYEGETLDNMKAGAGHFEFTSAWSGNIGIAGHNRGSSGYFKGVSTLKTGDEIIYTTKYGTRHYEVVSKEKISDTDYSWLGWTSDNRITLITCVEGSSNQRWCVQAVQK